MLIAVCCPPNLMSHVLKLSVVWHITISKILARELWQHFRARRKCAIHIWEERLLFFLRQQKQQQPDSQAQTEYKIP